MRYGYNTFNHTVWLGLAPMLPAQIDAATATATAPDATSTTCCAWST